MSSDPRPSDTPSAGAPLTGGNGESATPSKVFLVSYPKIVFFWPTFVWSLIAAAWMSFLGSLDPESGWQVFLAGSFVTVLGVNLVVLSFDFPRTTSLTLFFALASVGLVLWLVFSHNPDLIGVVGQWIAAIRPLANPTFFWIMAGILGVLFLVVTVTAQFDYWEVRANELLHHHGFMSDLERFPAPQLRIDKEINDVFEYLLLRSGRLILHPSTEPRAIVLENVVFINKKEQEITRLLGAMQVQIRSDKSEE